MENFSSELLQTLEQYYYDFIELLPAFGLGLLIFVVAIILANRIQAVTERRLTGRMDDPLFARFIANLTRITLIVIGILIVLKIVGLGGIASSILAGAGVSAFIIGFAFKDIGENFLAGIIMAFKRPFRLGDTIETGSVKGKIVGLNLRDTQVKTFDGKDVYIPNGMILKNPLINYTIDGYIRNDFNIGLDYGSDVNKAIRIIVDTLNQVPGVLKDDKKPSASVSNLGDSSMVITAYYWLDTFDAKVSGANVKTEATSRVLTALADAGFNLPGNIVELKNYQDREFQLKSGQNKEAASA